MRTGEGQRRAESDAFDRGGRISLEVDGQRATEAAGRTRPGQTAGHESAGDFECHGKAAWNCRGYSDAARGTGHFISEVGGVDALFVVAGIHSVY